MLAWLTVGDGQEPLQDPLHLDFDGNEYPNVRGGNLLPYLGRKLAGLTAGDCQEACRVPSTLTLMRMKSRGLWTAFL